MKTTTYYLLGVVAAVGAVLLLILAIGALGIIGDGGRDDRVYLAVPAVLVLGTIAARLRAPGMSVALLATAATQVLATLVALIAGVPEDASIVDILGINAMYAGLFCLSAWLFRRAAEQDSPVVPSLSCSAAVTTAFAGRPHGCRPPTDDAQTAWVSRLN